MIALSFFLFAIMIVSWLLMPGGERRLKIETPVIQPETQSA
jgi:hypothetical protein